MHAGRGKLAEYALGLLPAHVVERRLAGVAGAQDVERNASRIIVGRAGVGIDCANDLAGGVAHCVHCPGIVRRQTGVLYALVAFDLAVAGVRAVRPTVRERPLHAERAFPVLADEVEGV